MLKIEAPCKINLHLWIGDRRADGYHDLWSIFAALDFGDTLGFEILGVDGFCDILTDSQIPGVNPEFGSPVSVSKGNQGSAGTLGFPVPLEKNIVYKAVSLYRSRTGFNRGLRIYLEKRIPLGGGLGGGSSDAAAALMALNTLAGGPLSLPELAELAEQLGSDVPFFLSGGFAWVSGRGECIEPLSLPGNLPGRAGDLPDKLQNSSDKLSNLSVVLVNPGFPSGTVEAFRQLDLWREKGWVGRGSSGPSDEALKQALGSHPRDWPYENDFLSVFLAGKDGETGMVSNAAKAYGDIISRLGALGADFSGLSGAGSTCFGIFTDGGTAEKAAKALKNEWNTVQLTFFLARSAVTVLE
jgi:4-diphosphocytidyl-2-C-methyl-D-erythritol kinase